MLVDWLLSKIQKKKKKNELDKELLIEKKIKKNLFTRNITCTFTNFHCIYKYLWMVADNFIHKLFDILKGLPAGLSTFTTPNLKLRIELYISAER